MFFLNNNSEEADLFKKNFINWCIIHLNHKYMGKLVLETIQHSKLLDIDDVEPINDKDYEVLDEVRAVLDKHNYTDRFGMILLHKHFELQEDEILIEDTDTANRISTVKVTKESGSSEGTIETMWKFGKGVNAVTKCVLRCSYFLGHKRVHKKEGY